MEESPPKPRLLDILLEGYIKVGGFVGMILAIAVFAGVCMVSWWFFTLSPLERLHSVIIDIGMILATLFVAGTAAAFVFFTASVFWLPISIGLFFIALLLQDAMFRFHHLHSAAH